MFSKTLLFLTFLLTFHQLVKSQEIIAPDSTIHIGKKTKNLIGFPAVLHSPELTWAFGGAGTYYFKTNHRDTTDRTSFIQMLGIATLRKQLVLGFDASIFFPDERYILRIHGSVSRFPDRFWGLGNLSRDQDLESYSISQYYLFPQLLRKVYKKFYVGLAYESQNVFSFEYVAQQPNGNPSLFDVQQVPGRHGSFTSGLGLLLLWDSRNNAFSSSNGFYFQYYVNRFSGLLGSEYSYLNQQLDVRKYTALGNGTVLAFQVIANLNVGKVPLRSMANIGSGTIMRGYYEGRYTDKNLAAGQIELRQHVIDRFGIVAFAGVGRVANDLGDFNFHHWKPSLGGGVRVALDRHEKLNIRIDYGVGKNSHGLYLNLSEAF